MRRDSAFSYVCNACSRCCYNKAIRVGPYEVLRLSRRLGISTTEFIAKHTEAGGTVLVTRADGACGFLTERGCSVHPDRPLACRIYPLARWVDPDSGESFGHLEPHPQTAGVYGTSGTVAEYLESQGLAPYFTTGDRHGQVYDRMVDVLDRLDADESARRQERRAELDEMEAGSVASSWIDVDATVAAYCDAQGITVPTTIDAAVDLHIRALERWLDEIEARMAKN